MGPINWYALFLSWLFKLSCWSLLTGTSYSKGDTCSLGMWFSWFPWTAISRNVSWWEIFPSSNILILCLFNWNKGLLLSRKIYHIIHVYLAICMFNFIYIIIVLQINKDFYYWVQFVLCTSAVRGIFWYSLDWNSFQNNFQAINKFLMCYVTMLMNLIHIFFCLHFRILCPKDGQKGVVNILTIMSKVRLEAVMWVCKSSFFHFVKNNLQF